MATPEATPVAVTLDRADACTLLAAALGTLDLPLADDPERMALLALACQLRTALRG
jgi:hypothetical protein